MKQGSSICYHCKKKFSVRKLLPSFIFLSVVCAVLVMIDLAVIISTDNISPVIVIADLTAVTAAVLMLPLMVSFKPEKMTKSEKREACENNKK